VQIKANVCLVDYQYFQAGQLELCSKQALLVFKGANVYMPTLVICQYKSSAMLALLSCQGALLIVSLSSLHNLIVI